MPAKLRIIWTRAASMHSQTFLNILSHEGGGWIWQVPGLDNSRAKGSIPVTSSRDDAMKSGFCINMGSSTYRKLVLLLSPPPYFT